MRSCQHHIIQNGNLQDQAQVLKCSGDSKPCYFVRRQTCYFLSAYEAFAGVGSDESRKKINEGSLPGTVRADDCDYSGGRKRKINVVQGSDPIKRLGQFNATKRFHSDTTSTVTRIGKRFLELISKVH